MHTHRTDILFQAGAQTLVDICHSSIACRNIALAGINLCFEGDYAGKGGILVKQREALACMSGPGDAF